MCPACVASMALLAASATSSGGVTALALSKFLRKKRNQQTKKEQNETSRETDGNRIGT
jgi:membrane protein YqaA with SNARE-associated domain